MSLDVAVVMARCYPTLSRRQRRLRRRARAGGRRRGVACGSSTRNGFGLKGIVQVALPVDSTISACDLAQHDRTALARTASGHASACEFTIIGPVDEIKKGAHITARSNIVARQEESDEPFFEDVTGTAYPPSPTVEASGSCDMMGHAENVGNSDELRLGSGQANVLEEPTVKPRESPDRVGSVLDVKAAATTGARDDEDSDMNSFVYLRKFFEETRGQAQATERKRAAAERHRYYGDCEKGARTDDGYLTKLGAKQNCIICCRVGHKAYECPDLRCFMCFGTGHATKHCPNKDLKCESCGRKGHSTEQCWWKELRDAASKNNQHPARCLSCSKEGHLMCGFPGGWRPKREAEGSQSYWVEGGSRRGAEAAAEVRAALRGGGAAASGSYAAEQPHQRHAWGTATAGGSGSAALRHGRINNHNGDAWPASDIRPGDWTCPGCGVNVFASRDACFKCGAAKQRDVIYRSHQAAKGGREQRPGRSGRIEWRREVEGGEKRRQKKTKEKRRAGTGGRQSDSGKPRNRREVFASRGEAKAAAPNKANKKCRGEATRDAIAAELRAKLVHQRGRSGATPVRHRSADSHVERPWKRARR